jgi:hypothetical protein
VGTGKKARKKQKLGEHKEENGDEATSVAEVEVTEIVVEEITPAAVTEEATTDPVAEVEVTEIIVEEAAPAASDGRADRGGNRRGYCACS